MHFKVFSKLSPKIWSFKMHNLKAGNNFRWFFFISKDLAHKGIESLPQNQIFKS